MNAGRELGFNYRRHIFIIRNRLKKTENGNNSYWELVHTQKDYLSKHILSEKCYLIWKTESKHNVGYFCLLVNILCIVLVYLMG